MPRIEAEESLDWVKVLQVGTGTAKQSRAQKLISAWQRLARRTPRRSRKITPDEWRGRIAASGIALVIDDQPPVAGR